MSTVALQNLFNYIMGMSLSDKNKQWLADKLIESKTDSKRVAQEKMVRETLTRAIHEMREAERIGKKLPTLDEFLETLD